MSKKRTYLDTGVLVTMALGEEDLVEKGLEIFNDPDREFIVSAFQKLEVLPKAVYGEHKDEVELYEQFFSSAHYQVKASEHLSDEALTYAKAHGLGGMDALHIAAAIQANADELVTTEKPTKPMHRVTEVKVVSLYE